MVHKTPSYDTNMLPEVVFDKTAFVKLVTNNFERNIDETDLKQSKNHKNSACGFLKSQEKNTRTKSFEILPIFCDLKIYRKSIG